MSPAGRASCSRLNLGRIQAVTVALLSQRVLLTKPCPQTHMLQPYPQSGCAWSWVLKGLRHVK